MISCYIFIFIFTFTFCGERREMCHVPCVGRRDFSGLISRLEVGFNFSSICVHHLIPVLAHGDDEQP